MKRAFLLVVVTALLLVSLASAALAHPNATLEFAPEGCRVLTAVGDDLNVQGRERGLHNAHERSPVLFTDC